MVLVKAYSMETLARNWYVAIHSHCSNLVHSIYQSKKFSQPPAPTIYDITGKCNEVVREFDS